MEHLEGEAVVKLRREKSYHIIKELDVYKRQELIIKDSIDHGFISQKGILRLLNGKTTLLNINVNSTI